MTNDVLKRLRDATTREGRNELGIGHYWNLCEEAIAEIQALRVERHQLQNDLTAAGLENERLRAENLAIAHRLSFNDQAGAVEWANGLRLTWPEGKATADEPSEGLWRWEPGVMHFHSQDALRDRFYHVVNDLREAGCVVDLWLNDIAKVLTEYGYDMIIKRRHPESGAPRGEAGNRASPLVSPQTSEKSDEHPAAAHYRSLERCICADGSAGECPVHR